MKNGFTWQDYTVFSLILLLSIVFITQIAQFVHVPSPLYGGDYYRDRGFIQNIISGSPIYSDAFYYDELQYYPYLMSVILAIFVFITGLPIDTVFLWSMLLTYIFGGLVMYALGQRLYKYPPNQSCKHTIYKCFIHHN